MTTIALILLGLGVVLVLAAIRNEPLTGIVARAIGR